MDNMVRENTQVAVSENCFFKENLKRGGEVEFTLVLSLCVFKINPKNNMNPKKIKSESLWW